MRPVFGIGEPRAALARSVRDARFPPSHLDDCLRFQSRAAPLRSWVWRWGFGCGSRDHARRGWRLGSRRRVLFRRSVVERGWRVSRLRGDGWDRGRLGRWKWGGRRRRFQCWRSWRRGCRYRWRCGRRSGCCEWSVGPRRSRGRRRGRWEWWRRGAEWRERSGWTVWLAIGLPPSHDRSPQLCDGQVQRRCV
jgi:hypothetical protein